MHFYIKNKQKIRCIPSEHIMLASPPHSVGCFPHFSWIESLCFKSSWILLGRHFFQRDACYYYTSQQKFPTASYPHHENTLAPWLFEGTSRSIFFKEQVQKSVDQISSHVMARAPLNCCKTLVNGMIVMWRSGGKCRGG